MHLMELGVWCSGLLLETHLSRFIPWSARLVAGRLGRGRPKPVLSLTPTHTRRLPIGCVALATATPPHCELTLAGKWSIFLRFPRLGERTPVGRGRSGFLQFTVNLGTPVELGMLSGRRGWLKPWSCSCAWRRKWCGWRENTGIVLTLVFPPWPSARVTEVMLKEEISKGQ